MLRVGTCSSTLCVVRPIGSNGGELTTAKSSVERPTHRPGLPKHKHWCPTRDAFPLLELLRTRDPYATRTGLPWGITSPYGNDLQNPRLFLRYLEKNSGFSINPSPNMRVVLHSAKKRARKQQRSARPGGEVPPSAPKTGSHAGHAFGASLRSPRCARVSDPAPPATEDLHSSIRRRQHQFPHFALTFSLPTPADRVPGIVGRRPAERSSSCTRACADDTRIASLR